MRTGGPGLEYLIPILHNREAAPLFGPGAQVSRDDRYRRCDFAYRYISLILGLEAEYDDDVDDRDEEIEDLHEELRDLGYY